MPIADRRDADQPFRGGELARIETGISVVEIPIGPVFHFLRRQVTWIDQQGVGLLSGVGTRRACVEACPLSADRAGAI